MSAQDRSLERTLDTHKVPYNAGNRASRRKIIFQKLKLQAPRSFSKKIKLPKELWPEWRTGKSKYLDIRLREEGKTSIAELY